MTALTVPPEFESAHTFGDWTLYHVSAGDRDSFLWPRFKLMLPPGTVKKWGQRRVFTLHWSPLEQRFAKNRDSAALEAAHAPLAAQVRLHLELHYDRAWLERVFSAEEIEGERARLAAAGRAHRGGRRRR